MENHIPYSATINSEEEAVRYYSDLKKRLENYSRHYVEAPEYTPHAYTPTDAYLKNHLMNYSCEDLHRKADALIGTQKLDQNDEFIDHMSTKNRGDYHHFRSQWTPVAMQAREKTSEKTIKVGDKIVYTHDLSFSIAETLELQDSSRDPVTEYYDWIRIQNRIETDIYTSGTTQTEIDRRNFFIELMDKRETELKRIISLYSEAAFNSNSALQPIAQEKLKFLTFKLSELRRLRDKMSATKSQADRPEEDKQPMNSNEEVKKVKTHSYTFYSQPVVQKQEENTTKNEDVFNFMADRKLRELIDMHMALMMSANSQSKPLSQSKEEAVQKMERASQTKHSISDIIGALRNGMSKEELERQEAQINQTETRQKLQELRNRSIRGFDINAYNNALREMTA